MLRTFDWITDSNGRVRFAGSIRGWDERGHDTFAVEIDGRVWFGEIRPQYAGNVLFLEVVGFGWPQRHDVGIPEAVAAFSRATARRTEELARALVVSVSGYPRDEQPAMMTVSEKYLFSGDVVFADGWIKLTDDRG